MRTHLGVRLLVAAAVSLLVSPPVLAQSLRQQLVNFGSPLGSEQGMAVLAALGSLEVSTAPLGTSTGGFTFTFDPQVRVWTRSASSFGPAFAERSLTTGRGKVSAGFNVLHAKYDSFNDQQLDNFDFRPAQNIQGFVVSPAHSAVALDMSSTTVVGYAHIGVSDSVDVGLAVPWIRMKVAGDGRLVGSANQTVGTSTLTETSSSGIGDVALYGKYRFFRQDGGGAAAAVEVRLPTGDKDELRGLDVTRTLASVIWSHGGKVSPHANVGYEFWSGEASMSAAGDVFVKDQFKYAFGVEIEAHPRTTIVVDLVGRGVRHGGKVGYQTFAGAGGTSIYALVGIPEGLQQVSLAPGIKWNAAGSLLFVGNVLFSLSNSGLRANAIPVVGVDWAF